MLYFFAPTKIDPKSAQNPQSKSGFRPISDIVLGFGIAMLWGDSDDTKSCDSYEMVLRVRQRNYHDNADHRTPAGIKGENR